MSLKSEKFREKVSDDEFRYLSIYAVEMYEYGCSVSQISRIAGFDYRLVLSYLKDVCGYSPKGSRSERDVHPMPPPFDEWDRRGEEVETLGHWKRKRVRENFRWWWVITHHGEPIRGKISSERYADYVWENTAKRYR